MVFLLGKKGRSLSIKHPLGKRKDIQVLPKEKLKELKTRILSGDKNAEDELARSHIAYAIKIAGQYAAVTKSSPDDLVSEAMVGLTEAIREIAADKVPDEYITSRIAKCIHVRCSEFVRRDGILTVPHATALRKKKQDKPIVLPERHDLQYSQPGSKATREKQWVFQHPRMCTESDVKAVDLQDVLDKCMTSPRQRQIMDLVLDGHNVREISEILNIPPATVSLDIRTVRSAVSEMLK